MGETEPSHHARYLWYCHVEDVTRHPAKANGQKTSPISPKALAFVRRCCSVAVSL
jgi:hypothetical protein